MPISLTSTLLISFHLHLCILQLNSQIKLIQVFIVFCRSVVSSLHVSPQKKKFPDLMISLTACSRTVARYCLCISAQLHFLLCCRQLVARLPGNTVLIFVLAVIISSCGVCTEVRTKHLKLVTAFEDAIARTTVSCIPVIGRSPQEG
jgi:hypothetical protein